MMSLLALCKVESYIHSEIQQSNRDVDPVGYDNWKKKQKKEEMNQGEKVESEEDDNEHITFSLHEPSGIAFDNSEEGQFFNFDEFNVNNSSELNLPLLNYDWLGDSATTSHVSNRCEAFKTFHLLTGTTVSGVGNVKTKAKGQGTIEFFFKNHHMMAMNIFSNWRMSSISQQIVIT